jgi:predicted nucleic acid-binding protein
VRSLEALMNDERIVLSGQVELELLQGTRDGRAFARLERQLLLWTYEAETADDFREAALVYARLRRRGIMIPTSDCLVAAVARRCGLQVCASDPHVTHIPGLRLLAIKP